MPTTRPPSRTDGRQHAAARVQTARVGGVQQRPRDPCTRPGSRRTAGPGTRRASARAAGAATRPGRARSAARRSSRAPARARAAGPPPGLRRAAGPTTRRSRPAWPVRGCENTGARARLSARSRGQGVAGRGARASSSAYVADLPRGAPLQITPSSSARPSRCDSRPSAVETPAASSAARSSSRVRWPPPASARSRAARLRRNVRSSRSSSRNRRAARRTSTGRHQRQKPVQVGRRHQLPRPPHGVRADDGARLERRAGSPPRSRRVRPGASRPPSARRPDPAPGSRPSSRPAPAGIGVLVPRDALGGQAVRGDPRGVRWQRDCACPRGHAGVVAAGVRNGSYGRCISRARRRRQPDGR